MEDSKNSGGSGDSLLAIGGGLFFLMKLFDKFTRWWTAWIRVPVHQFSLALASGAICFALYYYLANKIEILFAKSAQEKAILGPALGAVYCGESDKNESVFIKPKQRAMHTQIIGTTNAGKTESVVMPWAIQDIEQGRGLILIDGKSDRSLLDKLWAYVEKSGRQKDFRLFSLSNIDESYQFNPLIGGTPEEVSERVFNSFDFDNPHYRSVQFEVFCQVMRVFEAVGEIPTFLRLHQAISNPATLKAMMKDRPQDPLKTWLDHFSSIPLSDRIESTSGLTAALSHFAFGRTAALFNTETPTIDLNEALNTNQIIYFQLPVLLTPFLGKASGKMILQCLQSAIANRHRRINRELPFYSVFLDDFTEYLYPGFVSVLNKSRSANVGIVFAHQALGDIKTLGDAIANSILTNANIKVFMRGNDPDSAEYFSKVIGTEKAVKYTERTKKSIWKNEATGDASAREVEEFIVHPNIFKNQLGVGEAVMIIPHESGSKAINIKFKKYDDLNASEIPKIQKTETKGLAIVEQKKPQTKEEIL